MRLFYRRGSALGLQLLPRCRSPCLPIKRFASSDDSPKPVWRPVSNNAHLRSRVIHKKADSKIPGSMRPADPIAMTALQQKGMRPIDIFEEAVARRTATVSLAAACLERYSVDLDVLSHEEVKTRLEADVPGKKVLRWLWDATTEDALDFMGMPSTEHLLCYFLYHEGEEEILWAWLKAYVPHFDTQKTRARHEKWRAQLLRALIVAKLDNDEADEALKSFFRALKLREEMRNSSQNPILQHMSLKPASVPLTSRLCKRNPPLVQAELYDQYIGVMRSLGWYADEHKTKFGNTDHSYVADLYLYHPAKPNARPALEVLAAFKRDPKLPGIYPKDLKQEVWLHRFMEKTLSVARQNGDHKDIEWVTNLLSECRNGAFRHESRTSSAAPNAGKR